MKRLPIGLGILAWKSGQTLVDTLTTYYESELFNLVDETLILFQEFSETDYQIAKHFGIDMIGVNSNIGIGAGFLKMANYVSTDYFLTLEHDFKLIENKETTYKMLSEGVEMIKRGYDVVRYRHRKNPGYPHFSRKYAGHELDYYDDWHECTAPHLLDSLHWLNPAESFPDKIQMDGDYFVTTSRWGNWTNNPCLYKTDFYKNIITPFMGEGIDLERKIAAYWPKQNYKVAHGEGLFTHKDLVKYGR
jgi:hypothetical protein